MDFGKAELNQGAAALMAQHLSRMGLQGQAIENGAEFIVQDMTCRTLFQIDAIDEMEGGCAAAVIFMLDLGANNVVEEFIVGYGETPKEAVLSAIHQWCGSMVAPVLALCGPIDFDEWGLQRITMLSKKGEQCIAWNVILGQIISNDQDGKLYKVLDASPPFTMVANAVMAQLPEEGLHWVKLYLARYPDGELNGEVRINNESDENALSDLKKFKWPTQQSMIWFRQFAALAPGEPLTQEEFEAVLASAKAQQ